MSTTYTIPGVLGEDEGAVLGFAGIMNFVGAGVTATYAGGILTVTIPGGGGGASGWTDGGTTVYLTTPTDQVSVGSNTAAAGRALSVWNTSASLFGQRITTVDLPTENILDTLCLNGVGPDDAAPRFAVNGAGDLAWGGGAVAPDLRIRRSGASTLTIDNGGAGAALIVPATDSAGTFGTNSLRWLDNIANTHRVFPSAGAVNASTSLGSGFLKLGVGGGTALDTAITRTAAATLTLDNNLGGSAVLIVKGTTNTQQRIHGQLTKAVADSPYTTLATDETIFWNCVGGNCTQNLPGPAGAGGRTLIVKRTDTTASTLTLIPAAGQVEGGATYIVAGGPVRASVTLMSDNANWWII